MSPQEILRTVSFSKSLLQRMLAHCLLRDVDGSASSERARRGSYDAFVGFSPRRIADSAPTREQAPRKMSGRVAVCRLTRQMCARRLSVARIRVREKPAWRRAPVARRVQNSRVALRTLLLVVDPRDVFRRAVNQRCARRVPGCGSDLRPRAFSALVVSCAVSFPSVVSSARSLKASRLQYRKF